MKPSKCHGKHGPRRRHLAATVLLGASLLLAACGPAVGHTTLFAAATRRAPSKPSQTHWQLTWSDEFNGTGHPTGWVYQVGGYGWGVKQLQWNGTQNAMLNGSGDLAITATRGLDGHACWYGPCKYAGAKLQTFGIFTQEYGRFEARIKLPSGRGLWPAFWLEGTGNASAGIRNGEIDIVEVNNRQPHVVTGYAHGPYHRYKAETILNEPASDNFHVFGVDWSPAGITWTLDGRAYGYFKSYAGWPFSHPFYLILDLAVGGGYPGPPTAQTKFPAQMLVDWVRVYRAIG